MKLKILFYTVTKPERSERNETFKQIFLKINFSICNIYKLRKVQHKKYSFGLNRYNIFHIETCPSTWYKPQKKHKIICTQCLLHYLQTNKKEMMNKLKFSRTYCMWRG